MRRKRFVAAWLSGAAAIAALVAFAPSAGAIAASPAAQQRGAGLSRSVPSLNTPMPSGGGGHAAPTAVDMRKLAASQRVVQPGPAFTPLGRDGRPVGAGLPRRASRGHRPMPAGASKTGASTTGASTSGASTSGASTSGGATAASGGAHGLAALAVPGANVNASFDGSHEVNCGSCIPSDSNAAVSTTEIVEAVNTQIRVTGKSGNQLCSFTLNTLMSKTSDILGDPRVVYDNVNNRFAVSATLKPASATSTPAMWVAATQTGDACGFWNTARITFNGTGYPAGTFLDFPELGQDRGGLLISTNNFCCGSSGGTSVGSFAFVVPKSAIYNQRPFSFTSFQVDGSTAPVTVAGNPMAVTTTTYWLASLPGTGYDLFSMPTGGGTITKQATISSPFNAPTRLVNQPGTSVTLDPSDGRIAWAPVQDGNFIWFAHGIDDTGFPTVRYGNIDVTNNTAQTAEAFHASDSDDFNPSIGVTDHVGLAEVWLNWAYTQSGEGVAASDTFNGGTMIGGPGSGLIPPVQTLAGSDQTLVSGSSTSQVDTNKGPSFGRFGDYSSVAVDPVTATSPSSGSQCAATAVTDQQYFDSNGNWVTRIARISFC